MHPLITELWFFYKGSELGPTSSLVLRFGRNAYVQKADHFLAINKVIKRMPEQASGESSNTRFAPGTASRPDTGS